DNNLSFEEGLDKLEAIVEEMESGDLKLDALVDRYEEGSKLLVQCDKKISEAEMKIEILRNKDASDPQFKDFDPDSED
ncbi:MAG: exodeoxyribonuclease VII small subunit, partial [Opitutaceae bacterium]|nr:exodeoxyribonuclease VII small subunit [Opitutaceae bacterium]